MAENIYFVAAAYAATWIVVIGYLLRLRSLMARARAALAHAQGQAKAAGGGA